MGCGHSKIHLYPRKSKSKTNGKKSGHGELGADTDGEEEGKIMETDKNACNASQKNDNGFDMEDGKISDADCELSVSIIRAKNLSLLQNQEISTSQQNFFEMLDRKIDEGPDYDSTSETEIALEEARLNALVQHWETASLTASICSSASRSLQSTPIHQLSSSALVSKTPQSHPASFQCMLPGSLGQEGLEVAGFVARNTPYRVPLSVDQAASEHHQQQQQQQLMITHIMQQMTSVPQQTQINALSQRLKPSTLGGSGASIAAAYSQPLQILTNVGANAADVTDSRALSTSLPRAHQLATMTSQMQPQNHYTSPPAPSSSPSQGFVSSARSPRSDINIMPSTQVNVPNQMVYYNQPATIMQQMAAQQMYQPSACFADSVVHNMQVESSPHTNTDYRFPAAISVQRLAPQVQRQLRETQELIKDVCPPSGYGSPSAPSSRSQTRNPSRRPTLESKFSQELS